VEVRIAGRASWRWFEAQYDEPFTVLFRRPGLAAPEDAAKIEAAHVLNGLLGGEALDRAARTLIEGNRPVPPAVMTYVSDATREWIAQRALAGRGGHDLLQSDPSDAVAAAILKESAAAPGAQAREIQRLLGVALSRLGPDEYAGALDRIGGRDKAPVLALRLLLNSRPAAVDHLALARLLADYPDPALAADAKAILGGR
jgi:hypothetical protein